MEVFIWILSCFFMKTVVILLSKNLFSKCVFINKVFYTLHSRWTPMGTGFAPSTRVFNSRCNMVLRNLKIEYSTSPHDVSPIWIILHAVLIKLNYTCIRTRCNVQIMMIIRTRFEIGTPELIECLALLGDKSRIFCTVKVLYYKEKTLSFKIGYWIGCCISFSITKNFSSTLYFLLNI